MSPRHLARFNSFGLRVALLSCLVSGVALVFSGVLTFAAMQRISLLRMDQQIRELTHRPLVDHQAPGHWERVSIALRFFLSGEEKDAFILLVKNRDGDLEYISENWPADLPVDDIPLPDAWGEYPKGEPPASQHERHHLPRPPVDLPGEPPREAPPPPVDVKAPLFSTCEAGGTEWRIGMVGSPDLTVVLGLNMKRLNTEMAQVRRALLTVLPITLLFVAFGAWWMSQRALKPIQAVTDTIKRVKSMGLVQRISVQDEDQAFSELITVFNEMMDWLEKSFHQATRFSADASHELKTPLTVLQAQLEQAVHEAEPNSDERRRYVSLAKELQRLKSITQKLLLLARIDAGELKLNLRPLNLSELVEGAVEDTETLAHHLNVESHVASDLSVMGDEDLMKQVVQNLTSNAVKFNRQGGYIRFNLQSSHDTVRLTITNSGPCIPPESRDEVFTRFHRGDKAHGRRVDGAGLGLSLAREIVRAHNGELVLEPSADDATVFSLTLRRASS